MKTIAELIEDRSRFYAAHISPMSPTATDAEMDEHIRTYDALTAAWQSAPCRTLSDIQTKVSFLLDSRNALNTTCENEGEAERLLQSFMFAKEASDLDRKDAIGVAYDFMEALIVMADGMVVGREVKNAIATIAYAAQQKLDEVR